MFDAFAGFAGRLLSYTRTDKMWAAAAVTKSHQASGLVLRGGNAVTEARRLRAGGSKQIVVVDVGEWSSADASAAAPVLPGGAGLFPTGGVDTWAGTVIDAGADVVLTRSLFVREAAWEALRAVLAAGRESTRPDVMTLIATDAAMLGRAQLPEFVRILTDGNGGRPLAFVFAGKNEPLGHRDRMAGLRAVLDQHPGSLLLGVDVLAGTDAITRGAGAAIGMTSSLRRPKRPKDDANPRRAIEPAHAPVRSPPQVPQRDQPEILDRHRRPGGQTHECVEHTELLHPAETALSAPAVLLTVHLNNRISDRAAHPSCALDHRVDTLHRQRERVGTRSGTHHAAQPSSAGATRAIASSDESVSPVMAISFVRPVGSGRRADGWPSASLTSPTWSPSPWEPLRDESVIQLPPAVQALRVPPE